MTGVLDKLEGAYDIAILSYISYVIRNPVGTSIFIDANATKMGEGYTEYWILKNSVKDSHMYYPCNCSYAYLAQKNNSDRYESLIRSDIQITLSKNNYADIIYCPHYDCLVYWYCEQTLR